MIKNAVFFFISFHLGQQEQNWKSAFIPNAIKYHFPQRKTVCPQTVFQTVLLILLKDHYLVPQVRLQVSSLTNKIQLDSMHESHSLATYTEGE